MIRDLRDFIARCEEIGELRRVKAQVDWDMEISHLADLNDAKRGGALLFENVKDSAFPLLVGALSSAKRCAIALDMPVEYTQAQMAREWMQRVLKNRIPPRVVATGPVLENVVEGSDVDLFKLPVPRFYPLDGGRYIGTNASLITADPDTGWTNVGTYRLQLHDRNRIGVCILKGKHADTMVNRHRELGTKMPAAVAIGQLPALFLFSSAGVPLGISEYDYAGAVRGEPVDVVKSDLTGLLIPATAEWVIEGEINPDRASFMPEGPFGEFPGYYSAQEAQSFPKPVLEVKRILHRNNAIFWCQTVGSVGPGKNIIPSIQISAQIWADLANLRIPGIQAVFCPPEFGGRFACVVSIKQMYPGHVSQVGHAVAATPVGNYRSKIIIVVDEDIRPDDIDQVLWAVANRFTPERSVQIFRRAYVEPLDPGLPVDERDIGAKLFIDATIPYEWKQKPVMVELDPKTVEKVQSRWNDYDLGIEAP